MAYPFVFYSNGRGRFVMTPGQLVKAVAIALDVPEETVVQHDRNLVVAGLRTKGGRGRSAPSVTPRDAARLITAVLGSVKVKDSAPVVGFLEAARVSPGRQGYSPLPFPRFCELPPDHSFVDALTAIIGEMDTPQMFDNFSEYARRFGGFWISVHGRVATISYFPDLRPEKSVQILYTRPRAEQRPPKTKKRSGWDWEWQWSWLDFHGVEQERKIRGNCLMMLGRSFQQSAPSSAETVFRDWSAALKKAAP
jgi:hypothetical protein